MEMFVWYDLVHTIFQRRYMSHELKMRLGKAFTGLATNLLDVASLAGNLAQDESFNIN
jgi:hypothetical protein